MYITTLTLWKLTGLSRIMLIYLAFDELQNGIFSRGYIYTLLIIETEV